MDKEFIIEDLLTFVQKELGMDEIVAARFISKTIRLGIKDFLALPQEARETVISYLCASCEA